MPGLAARLTGWKVDIKSETQAEEAREEIEALLEEEREPRPRLKRNWSLKRPPFPRLRKIWREG